MSVTFILLTLSQHEMLATFSNITSAAFSLRVRYVCFIFAECEKYAQLNPLRMLHIIRQNNFLFFS